MSDKVRNPDVLATGQEPDKDRIVSRETRRSKEHEADRPATAIKRAVRNAERQAGDGTEISGTGYTILKMRQKPLERLIEAGKIGMEEMQAAEEIERAFRVISSPVAIRSVGLDRVDCGNHQQGALSDRTSRAIRNYQAWAKYWTKRNDLLCDPMLEIIIAAVVDEHSVLQISADTGRKTSCVKDGIVCGLRDYAARAGFVSPGRAQAWRTAAAQVFAPKNEKLAIAMHRAAVEI